MGKGRIAVESRHDPQISNMLDVDSLDPEMHYRFVQMRSARVARAKRDGYKTVLRKEHGVRTLVGQDEDDGTGTIRDGDTVLMMMPKTEAQRRDRKTNSRRVGRLRSAERRFRKLAEDAGVRVADAGVGRDEPKYPGE